MIWECDAILVYDVKEHNTTVCKQHLFAPLLLKLKDNIHATRQRKLIKGVQL